MWRGLGVAMRAPDLLGRCIAAGATMGIVGQAMINIAVLTSSVPFTGITLPFFSYGGSSIIACCAMCGLILSVSRHVPREANQGVWWANWRALRHAAAS
jgi:cell division protein FtsW